MRDTPTPWIGLAALVCDAPWSAGHHCAPETGATGSPPLQGELPPPDAAGHQPSGPHRHERNHRWFQGSMRSMTSQPTVSASPRHRLLTTATRLFLEEGIRAVGISRIIAEADVALMTLYRQFGGKDELVAAAVEQWSAQWLQWLRDQLDACGDDPDARLEGLWTALDEWLTSKEFRGSLVANAATELRARPDHPARQAIIEHQLAMRQLLEDLAKLAGAADPTALAAQLHVLVEGAVAVAIVDRRSASAPSVRALAKAALAASSASWSGAY
jgi:AcrR family transcriptional regulator